MKKILLFLLFMTISFAQAKVGSEGVGGGDFCENRIKIVRDDIQKWIKDDGAIKLILPNDITAKDYSNEMLSYIKLTKVRCVSSGDIGFPVSVEGVPKVCRFDKNEKTSTITCDYNKFQAATDSNQYLLIHHEYAGLADIEIPNGSDSDYSVSNQITSFLVDQVIKKLSVNPDIFKSYEILNTPQTPAFALAWGVPGKKINFNLFNDNIEDIFRYMEKNETANFIVNTKTNKIVKTIGAGLTLFNAGDVIYGGNHYNLSLSELLVEVDEDANSDCFHSAGLIVRRKWNKELSDIVIANVCSEDATVVINTMKLNDSIEKQMKSFVNNENLSVIERASGSIKVLDTALSNGQWGNRIRYTYEIPKNLTSKIVTLEAIIKLSYKNKALIAKVLAVEQIAE